ncbi:MAG TPA: mannose-6-phosphate isomerase, class I [Flavisolibacter sp.]|nr:mannose-6-phosphate isomerase, class I [Flavisolibacter sp.]
MELKEVYRLKGIVQHYSWGGYDYIPQLLGQANESHQPFAEYWLGAHPNFPSQIQNGTDLDLGLLIKTDPDGVLGLRVSDKFSSLPYLFKVLDVRQMLSIQVHPDKSSAKKGFVNENQKGIPLKASHRNYKDENHKPELMVALSDFWLLHGFKKEQDLLQILNDVHELQFLEKTFKASGYKGIYEEIMLMDQTMVNSILEPLLKRITPVYERGELKKEQEDFWAARASKTFCQYGQYDRGIFSIYLFNLVHLEKGQGVFQPEGMPHAYLEGQNVEVMANSDNVLRAGLTEKHIDVEQLLQHIKFEPTIPEIINPAAKDIRVYGSPVEEFELIEYNLQTRQIVKIESKTAEICLLIDGDLHLSCNEKSLNLQKGQSIFIIAGSKISVTANLPSQLFRVTIPL